MADYQKMYHIMFNAATDAERLAREAAALLRKAQQIGEELYVNAQDTPIPLHTSSNIHAAGE